MATRWTRRFFRLPPGLSLQAARDRLGDLQPVSGRADLYVIEEGDTVEMTAPRRREGDYLDLPEVTYVGVNASVGIFVYTRWVHGELARDLCYVADSGWTRVEGEPEAWEAEAIFGEEARGVLEECLDGYDPAEAQRAREAFAARRLVAGATFPIADAERLSWSHG